jgi:hypothetical protein
VLRWPQHAALIYIIIVPDMHGQKVDAENYRIAAATVERESPPALKDEQMRSGGWTRSDCFDNPWVLFSGERLPQRVSVDDSTI